jgi:hypothetical protein
MRQIKLQNKKLFINHNKLKINIKKTDINKNKIKFYRIDLF